MSSLLHSRDTSPRDIRPHDAGPRDARPRNTSPRDAQPRNTSPRDARPRNTGPRGAHSGLAFGLAALVGVASACSGKAASGSAGADTNSEDVKEIKVAAA